MRTITVFPSYDGASAVNPGTLTGEYVPADVARRLLAALKACEVVMDTAAMHELPQALPPAYRESWGMAHIEARNAIAAAE